MIRFAVPALLVAALCATTTSASEQQAPRPDQKGAAWLQGFVPGKPVRCVHRDRISQLRGVAGDILLVGGRGRVFRSQTRGTCPGLSRGDRIEVQTIGGDYCQGDAVQTRAVGGNLSGLCALGPLVPYTKAVE